MDLLAPVATPLLAYLLITGLVALDATFPAIPSDAVIVSAGALAATGHLDVGWVAAAVVAGAMGGDHLVYAFARHRLPGVLERSRFGRRVQRNAHRAYARIDGVSTMTLAMARFIPFGRTAAAGTAGLVGIPPRRYVWISMLGATTWAAWMVGLGYFAGRATHGPMWLQVLVAVGVGFVVAAALAWIQQIVLRRRRRNAAPQQVDRTAELVQTPC